MNFLNFINEDYVKILASMVAGSIIGAEREYKSKNAGFRTITLITIGATLYTLLSNRIANGVDFHVVGNIVVGVGFLGAGAIFKDGANVSGLTTAATIWISAAIGMAIGAGEYSFAFLTLVTVLVILLGFSGIQSIIDNRNAERYYKICIRNQSDSYIFIKNIIKECKLKSRQVSISKIDDKLRYTFKISGGVHKHQQLVSLLSSSNEIISFEV
ncbi:MAG: MgtC/SapB family protein [Bacteroidetes bacterium]|nr:MgtC/SapB family protein [Bacteroidota bacterium]